MKGIVLSREDNGAIVIDEDGSFRYVRGYENAAIGTKIDLSDKPKSVYVRKKRYHD